MPSLGETFKRVIFPALLDRFVNKDKTTNKTTQASTQKAQQVQAAESNIQSDYGGQILRISPSAVPIPLVYGYTAIRTPTTFHATGDFWPNPNDRGRLTNSFAEFRINPAGRRGLQEAKNGRSQILITQDTITLGEIDDVTFCKVDDTLVTDEKFNDEGDYSNPPNLFGEWYQPNSIPADAPIRRFAIGATSSVTETIEGEEVGADQVSTNGTGTPTVLSNTSGAITFAFGWGGAQNGSTAYIVDRVGLGYVYDHAAGTITRVAQSGGAGQILGGADAVGVGSAWFRNKLYTVFVSAGRAELYEYDPTDADSFQSPVESWLSGTVPFDPDQVGVMAIDDILYIFTSNALYAWSDTVPEKPSAPTVVTCSDTSVEVTTDPTDTTSKLKDVEFDWRIAADEAFNDIISTGVSPISEAPIHEFVDLDTLQDYWVDVKARNSEGTGPTSDATKVRTLAPASEKSCTATEVPPTPGAITVYDVGTYGAWFRIDEVGSPLGAAQVRGYRWQWSEQSDFSDLTDKTNELASQHNFNRAYGAPGPTRPRHTIPVVTNWGSHFENKPGTLYYVRVRSENCFGSSDWSTVATYTTKGSATLDSRSTPLTPSITGTTGTTISASIGMARGVENVTGYAWVIATDSAFTNIVDIETSDARTSPSVTFTGLEPETQYFVRVRATNDASQTAVSGTAVGRTTGLGEAYDRLSQRVCLPPYPAAGSRNGLIPKFDGDVLKWLPDATATAPMPPMEKTLTATIQGPTSVRAGRAADYTITIRGTATGTITYQWQTRIGDGVWTDQATTRDFSFTGDAGSTYEVRCTAMRDGVTAMSNIITTAWRHTLQAAILNHAGMPISASTPDYIINGTTGTFMSQVTGSATGGITYAWTARERLDHRPSPFSIGTSATATLDGKSNTTYRLDLNVTRESISVDAPWREAQWIAVTAAIRGPTGDIEYNTEADFTCTADSPINNDFHYQWQRSRRGFNRWTNVGTDSSTYSYTGSSDRPVDIRCIVTQEDVSGSVTTNVLQPNWLVKVPTVNVVIDGPTRKGNGLQADYTATVTGTAVGSITYVWERRVGNGAWGPSNPSFTGEDDTTYSVRCTVTREGVSDVSNIITTTWETGLIVSITGPTSRDIGQEATYNCTVGGAFTGPIAYTWQRRIGNGSWTNLLSSNTNEYSFTGSPGTSYSIRCRVIRANDTVLSNVIRTHWPESMPADPEVLSASVFGPGFCEVGEMPEFRVGVHGTATGPVTYQWERRKVNNDVFPTVYFKWVKTSTDSIYVFTSTERTSYEIRCTVTRANVTATSPAVELFCNVASPFDVGIRGPDCPRSDATGHFYIDYFGGPRRLQSGTSFQWQRRTGTSGAWSNVGSAVLWSSGDTDYEFDGADATTYQIRCIATQSSSTATSNVITSTWEDPTLSATLSITGPSSVPVRSTQTYTLNGTSAGDTFEFWVLNKRSTTLTTQTNVAPDCPGTFSNMADAKVIRNGRVGFVEKDVTIIPILTDAALDFGIWPNDSDIFTYYYNRSRNFSAQMVPISEFVCTALDEDQWSTTTFQWTVSGNATINGSASNNQVQLDFGSESAGSTFTLTCVATLPNGETLTDTITPTLEHRETLTVTIDGPTTAATSDSVRYEATVGGTATGEIEYEWRVSFTGAQGGETEFAGDQRIIEFGPDTRNMSLRCEVRRGGLTADSNSINLTRT